MWDEPGPKTLRRNGQGWELSRTRVWKEPAALPSLSPFSLAEAMHSRCTKHPGFGISQVKHSSLQSVSIATLLSVCTSEKSLVPSLHNPWNHKTWIRGEAFLAACEKFCAAVSNTSALCLLRSDSSCQCFPIGRCLLYAVCFVLEALWGFFPF